MEHNDDDNRGGNAEDHPDGNPPMLPASVADALLHVYLEVIEADSSMSAVSLIDVRWCGGRPSSLKCRRLDRACRGRDAMIM